jgi:uncharacterized protein (TIGR03086 family)
MALAGTSGDAATAPPDLRALHDRAARRFVEHVARIASDQWHLGTPCSEWDVRALVDHVARWNAFVPEFLAGRSLADIVAPFERDVLGDDPIAASRDSARQAVVAFDAPGALERLVHHPYGEIPGAQVLYLRLFDNTIHDWDLMRALGIDEPLDADAAAVLYAGSLAQREVIRASGHFGIAEVAVATDADVATRLLGLLGRKP